VLQATTNTTTTNTATAVTYFLFCITFPAFSSHFTLVQVPKSEPVKNCEEGLYGSNAFPLPNQWRQSTEGNVLQTTIHLSLLSEWYDVIKNT